MADPLFDNNADAFMEVEAAIIGLAQKLDFDYTIQWQFPSAAGVSPLDSHHPRHAFGHLYRKIPHTFGIFAIEEDVRLYCRTSMRLELLREHMSVQLGLEKSAALAVQDGNIVITHEQLVKSKIALPNSLNLEIIPIGMTDRTTTEFEDRILANFEVMFHANAQELFTLFPKTYMQLREWAYRVGILSKECRLLSEEFLVSRYTDVFLKQDLTGMANAPPNDDLLYRIIRDPNFCKLASSPSTNDIPHQHMRAIERKFDATAEKTTDVIKWTVESLNDFIEPRPLFIVIEASCWKLSAQGKLAQHRFLNRVRQLVTQVQAIHDKSPSLPNTLSLTIRPELRISSEQSDHITFLLGLNCPPGNYGDRIVNRERMEKECEAVFTAKVLTDFDGTLQHEVIDQDMLRARLGNLTDVAHKLPDMFRSHLDVLPISDPLWKKNEDEEAASTYDQQQKFRTSQEIMNRLQWDPKHASKRYEVGYKDRFEEELLWKPLEQWTKDKQSDDFVPMHRIYQFREIPTDTIVWDREKKMDRTG